MSDQWWHLADSDLFPDWPNCATADCRNKSCTWSERPELCHPCGERVLGRPAMDARFKATNPDDEGDDE